MITQVTPRTIKLVHTSEDGRETDLTVGIEIDSGLGIQEIAIPVRTENVDKGAIIACEYLASWAAMLSEMATEKAQKLKLSQTKQGSSTQIR
jgi:hypothetical protein